MPNPYFVILELIAYTLFAACLWHAWQLSIRPASTASSARFINQTPYSYNSTN